MGELAQMGADGDTKIIWDPDKPHEVAAAKASFDALVKKGYWAFKVTGKDGAQGERIREFDADAGRIILAPQMQGG